MMGIVGIRGIRGLSRHEGGCGMGGPASYDFSGGTMPTGSSILRATVGTYFDAAGDIVTAPTDTARFDHNPITGAYLGLLLEGSATNSALYSAASSANWSATGGGSSVDLSIGALGVFDGVEFTSAGPSHTLRTAANFVTGSSVFTFYFRMGSSGQSRFTMAVGSSQLSLRYRPLISPDVGLLSNTLCTSYTASVEILSDGLTYRVQVSVVDAVAGAGTFGVGPAGASGETVIVLGGQYESGTSETSYIATSGAAVTRAADQLVVSNLSGAYDLELTYEGGSTQTLSGVSFSGATTVSAQSGRLLSMEATPT